MKIVGLFAPRGDGNFCVIVTHKRTIVLKSLDSSPREGTETRNLFKSTHSTPSNRWTLRPERGRKLIEVVGIAQVIQIVGLFAPRGDGNLGRLEIYLISNLVSLDSSPREGTETFCFLACCWPFSGLSLDSSPREGTETTRAELSQCQRDLERSLDSSPREGTETLYPPS